MKITQVAKWILSIGILFGCNQQSILSSDNDKDSEDTSNEDGDFVVEDEGPSDSTGASIPVVLQMQSSTDAGLALTEGETDTTDAAADGADAAAEAEPAATDLKISDSLTVSMARFNLWAIKVKAKHEQSEKEKQLEAKEKDEDKKDAEELEVEVGAALTDDELDSDSEKPEKLEKSEEDKDDAMTDKIKDKIAEKREHYKNKLDEDKKRDDSRDKSRKFHGPFIYDAVAGSMEGDAPAVELNDGSYRRIEFKLKRNVTAEEGDPILGNVFVIRGSYNKGENAEPVAFEIDWHSAMNFRLRGEDAYKVEAEGDSKLAIVFDMGKWFDGIDMATAEVGEDGVIHINKKSNKEIMKSLRRNIKVNTRFGKDKDGNGKLDESETVGQGEDTSDTE